MVPSTAIWAMNLDLHVQCRPLSPEPPSKSANPEKVSPVCSRTFNLAVQP